MQYSFTPPALRELEELKPIDHQRVLSALDEYARTGVGAKKLVGRRAQWRLRVGQLRVIFERDRASVVVVAVRNRRDAYR